MATAAQTIQRSWNPSHDLRKFTAVATTTLFGFLVLLIFLLPLAYMFSTSVKSMEQVANLRDIFFASSPDTYTYEGKEIPLYKVPLPDGTTKVLGLVEAGRNASKFIDPKNPGAGLIQWEGKWRALEPSTHFSPTWSNFANAWKAINMGILFRNTFIIAITGTIGTLLSSICVAYGFARFRIPYSNAIFMVLIATIILPTQVTLIPTYIFFRLIGWGGTWWPLIIPHFFANAYNVFLLRQYFRGIPRDLDESAMIDGASPFRILLSVIIPQSFPAILAVAMFHFFWAWNDFFTPLVYLQGKENLYTISIGLTQFNNIYSTVPGYLQSAAIMAVALPVVIFFFAQRVFMQGIVITGVEK